MSCGVHVVLPNDVDDPATPSGGNRYDRRVCRGLAALGWSVREHAVCGGWPLPGPGERAELARILRSLPGGTLVLLDGLVASTVPEVLVPQAARLRLVVLVHMPIAGRAERDVLTSVEAVIATSAWSRRRLLEEYRLPDERVHVAPPGVDPAPLAVGSHDGSALLCVAAVIPSKGYDVLAGALARLRNLPFSCTCVGALNRDPEYVEHLRGEIRTLGLTSRMTLVGPRTGDDLDAAYAATDLLVLASHHETYAMVVTEALARGIPVLATAVGGVPEALCGAQIVGGPGSLSGSDRPGLLVPPGDPVALAGAIGRWLTDPDLRNRLRDTARDRRGSLAGWPVTARAVSSVLGALARAGEGRAS